MTTCFRKIAYLMTLALFMLGQNYLLADVDDLDDDDISDNRDLFDRNEEQADYNPYDYPSDIQPYNTRSIYWQEMKRIETLSGYQDDTNYRSIHDNIPEMKDKAFTSRVHYSPFEYMTPQEAIQQQQAAAINQQNERSQQPGIGSQQQGPTQMTKRQQRLQNPNTQYTRTEQVDPLYYQTQYQNAQIQYGESQSGNYSQPYYQQTQSEYYEGSYPSGNSYQQNNNYQR